MLVDTTACDAGEVARALGDDEEQATGGRQGSKQANRLT
jgi:hypothetical protein